MDKNLAQIIILAAAALMREAPALYTSIVATLAKQNVTPEEIEALAEQIRADTYEKLVPNTNLPK